MKTYILYFFSALTLCLNLKAKEDWRQSTFQDRGDSIVYVGVSQGRKSLDQALEDAYLNALKEAIRHNFSQQVNLSETVYQGLTEADYQQRSTVNFGQVRFVGVTPGRQSVLKEQDDSYIVYREIIYQKDEILKEKNRLSSLGTVFQTYGAQDPHQKLCVLELTAYPERFQFTIEGVNHKYSSLGNGPAKIFLPLGRYKVTVRQSGYVSESRKLLVQTDEKLHLELKAETRKVLFDVFPRDAQLKIGNRELNSKEDFLSVSQEFTVTAEHPDYHSQSKSFRVEGTSTAKHSDHGQAQVVVLKLAPRSSELLVSFKTEGQFYVNDRFHSSVSPTKPVSIELEGESSHTLRFSKPGYADINKTIRLLPNRSRSLGFGWPSVDRVDSPDREAGINRFAYSPFRQTEEESSVLSAGVDMAFSVSSDSHWKIYGDFDYQEKTLNRNAKSYNREETFVAVGVGREILSLGILKVDASLDISRRTFTYRKYENDNLVGKQEQAYTGVGPSLRGQVQVFRTFGLYFETQYHFSELQERRSSLGVGYEF